MGKKKNPTAGRKYVVKAIDLQSGNTYVEPESRDNPLTDLKAAHRKADQFASECRQMTGRGYFPVVDWI